VARAERIPEIALSAAWQSAQIPDQLVSTDGASVRVIHRGTWTHGLGPDFADALLLFDERELRSGAVEMHLETRSWTSHGHQLDPAYDAVILHVVARHDGSLTRRADGSLVPVVEVSLPDISHLPMALLDWDRVGGAVCAPRLAQSSPSTLREILFNLGDTRLSARSAQIEAALLDVPPAEVLWRAILGGLGYSRNQSPMRRLAERLPLATLNDLRLTRPSASRFHLTLGLLLGVSSFLPLSPTEAHLIRLEPDEINEIESAWQTLGSPWHLDHLAASEWDRARVRPANHPLPRLHAAAALAHNVTPEGGLLAAVQSVLVADDPVTSLCHFTRMGRMPGIGADRAIEILASGILPVLFAVGSHTDDDQLVEAAANLWEKLPAPTATSVTKRAARQVSGGSSMRGIGARGAQGLIHLDTALCLPRRCFDCPIAAAELSVNE
jgi:hypothetical protein